MRIVEALILAPSPGQDQLLLGNRNRPRHAASAIAMLHPVHRIRPIAAFQPLHLTLHFQSPSPVGTLSDSSSPSLEGDRVSLQLWGDIILEHLHLEYVLNPRVLTPDVQIGRAHV